MRKTIILLVLAALCACQESLEKRCEREAITFTKKNCPAKLSDAITVDSMAFHQPTLTIHYYYKLTGEADDSTQVNAKEWREQLLTSLKNATTMKAYMDAGYNVQYTYYSASNPKTVLFEALFKPEDYRNN
ncbi:MAG: hypothetical protein IJP74_08755 [Prevotella sp.]|nr:hypothetical protein [Prevotella sp.]